MELERHKRPAWNTESYVINNSTLNAWFKPWTVGHKPNIQIYNLISPSGAAIYLNLFRNFFLSENKTTFSYCLLSRVKCFK